jgi:hypothetical protein
MENEEKQIYENRAKGQDGREFQGLRLEGQGENGIHPGEKENHPPQVGHHPQGQNGHPMRQQGTHENAQSGRSEEENRDERAPGNAGKFIRDQQAMGVLENRERGDMQEVKQECPQEEKKNLQK